MDIIILFGPQAVGKMTVGEEIEKLTGIKLFHNHMTIDLILNFFTWDEGLDLIVKFRQDIMTKLASLPDKRGMTFTVVWAFSHQEDWDYIENINNIFKEHNVFYVELNADLDTRLIRNKTENRLSKKWTKKDIPNSDKRLKNAMSKYRSTSNPGEIPYNNYIRIDNTSLDAAETAMQIVEHFDLERL